MIKYFAYGSNMDEDDLKEWCCKKHHKIPDFQNIRPAKLNGYKLSFNYFSKCRGGGAANIMLSSNNCVYGLLTEITDDDLNTIRKKEGYSKEPLKRNYDEICIDVEAEGEIIPHVKTYKVSKSHEEPNNISPSKEYLDLIVNNSKKYRFPPEYIRNVIQEAGIPNYTH